jgi:hypothetical protein
MSITPLPEGDSKPESPADAAIPPADVSLAQAAASAAAALFGVQSPANRERDFNAKSPAKFIVMGTVMTCLFILCVLIAVRCSMEQAGVVP